MIYKTYYYSLADLNEEVKPFKVTSIKTFLEWALDCTEEQLSGFQLPSDLSTNESIYNEFISLVFGRYYQMPVIKINKFVWEGNPSNEEVAEHFTRWGYKFISKLMITYEYYVPLINFYRSNKADLMADIVATSENAVAFNDTPQNANTSGIYEGDDYINQFTKTRGTSSSPLTTKINRLKEIQDGYKNVMADWVKDFEALFIEVQGYEEH